jgi:hypothetical protein
MGKSESLPIATLTKTSDFSAIFSPQRQLNIKKRVHIRGLFPRLPMLIRSGRRLR